jgi:Ca-activated chloride channel family protein
VKPRIIPLFCLVLALGSTASPARAWDPLQKARRAAQQGGEHLKAGDAKQAVEDYARAQAYRPQDPDYRLGLGEALYADGDLKGAMGQFLAAANADDPGRAYQALYNAGNVALASGDPKRALALYQKALLKGKPDQDLLTNLELAQRLAEAQKKKQNDKQKQGSQKDQRQNQKQDQKQNQNQQQDQQKGQEKGRKQQDNQEEKGEKNFQQNRENQEQENQAQQKPEQDQKSPQEKAEQQSAAAADSTRQAPASADSTQTATADSLPQVGVMSRQEAMRLLNALDHDEEELRRSIQRRLRKTENKSKHEW